MELLMNIRVLAGSCAVLFFSGCTGLTEKAGQFLEASLFEEKVLETYQGTDRETPMTLRRIRLRDGTEQMTLAPDSFPGLKLYLALGENSPEGIFPRSCYFIASGPYGWNEWTMELSGSGSIAASGGGWRIKLDGVEPLGISRGRIRLKDERISGEEALDALENRRLRIEALVAWMKENPLPAAESGVPGEPAGRATAFPSRTAFQSQKEFERRWKPVLFPELVPRRKRPGSYSARGADWVRAGELRWNSGYTREQFPGDIGRLRDTGTLLRDWEEALPWIYLAYQWDTLVEVITKELYFTK
jgi:hypothetical protein